MGNKFVLKNRKTICQILVQHIEGELLIMKRSGGSELYPGKYEIAVCEEVKENEKIEESVKRIVMEQTGMHCESFEKMNEDICLGASILKKCFTCIVSGEKESLHMSIPEIEEFKWIPKFQWKELLESGNLLENERISYHDFFYKNGMAPRYYVDEKDIYEYSFETMESDANVNRDLYGKDVKSAYAWYDKNIDGVQFYIWDTELSEGYLHYIINENTKWTKEEEERFDYYARAGMIYEGIDASTIFRIYMNKYPDWRLTYESDGDPWELLASIHYYLQGGAKKILFENGLGELAQSLSELSIEYFENGNTPSEILFDLPFPVLQSINSQRGATLLTNLKMRNALKAFYQEAPEFFGKKLTDSRMYDLETILMSKQGRHDMQEAYYMDPDLGVNDLVNYIKYFENREQLADITKNLPFCPPVKSRGRFYYKAEQMAGYLMHEEEINAELQMICEELREKYAYQDEKYEMIVLRDLKEYLRKAEEMFHDYWQFIEFIVERQTSILLLVDKQANNSTVASIEVVGDSIIDVRGKYNMDVDEQLMAWIENYAREKNLVCNKMENEDDLPLPFD